MSDLWERAKAVMPGGVNSPVRAFGAVGGTPPFIVQGEGARVRTAEGIELIDFVASWGALILGHAHPDVVRAVQAATAAGTSFGLPNPAEVELAELIVDMVPSIEVVRMVNSGTEATASAIRLARAATGRSVIIKFEGGYHGHADPFLVKAGSGLATFGTPSSPGVPAGTAGDTRVARFNDLVSVEAQMDESVATIIVEPVAGNMGCIPPHPGFLEGLRSLCDRNGSLLVFDEVMTGFRVGPASAQGLYGVTPDLTTLGKVVAGGAPAAAYGGRTDLMRMIAPDGPVYQAGTLAGNPPATAAGLVTLRYLRDHPELYQRFEEAGSRIEDTITKAAESVGMRATVHHVGGMIGVFLGVDRVASWDDVADVDVELFNRFFHAALRRGVLLPPSAFETWFLMEAVIGEPLDEATAALEASVQEAAS